MIKIIDGEMLIRGLKAGRNKLVANKEMVNSLNVFPVPDGDTGTNMSKTIDSAVKMLEDVNDVKVSTIVKKASTGALMGARGNSGVILSQLLRGLSSGVKGLEVINIENLKDAFIEAKKVAYNAVMKPTEGTILTVARMMAEYAEENYRNFDDISVFLKAILDEGNRALEMTPDMLPQLKAAGVVDAGGKGYLLILEGILHGLVSDEEEEYVVNVDNFEVFANKAHHESENIEFGYCTEFMIMASDGKPEDLREKLSKIGDCVIVVQDEDVTKVHVHTNEPGTALQYALEIGQLKDIKIENMRQQNENLSKAKEEVTKELVHRKYAIIAVSTGQGIDKVFNDLGVAKIISGGQTMNPSTEDFVKAINEVNADNIIILPNNKNIILAAKQAKDLVDSKVEVLETTSIPQGLSAMLVMDEDISIEENIENMQESIAMVKTLQVTYAVRDSQYEDITIKKDDYIGMINGKIRVSKADIYESTLELIEKAVDEETSLITIFKGADLKDQEADKLISKLEEIYSDLDIEVVDGKQPVYYYLISVE